MDHARAQAIVANISPFLIEMGSADGGDERRDAEITWTVGGSPIGYHNAVVHCDAAPHRADALIEQWAAELRSRHLAASWHLSPFMTPHDLAERLAAHGFRDAGEEPAMAAGLATTPPQLHAPHSLAGRIVDGLLGVSAARLRRDLPIRALRVVALGI